MDRYTRVAIALHWIIALLVIANIGLAGLTEDFSREARVPYMDLHKAIGISVLVLTLARIAWRIGHKPPPLPLSMRPWERSLARITHFAFYLLLIGLPLSGWLWMSTYPAPFAYFGLFDVPLWPVAGQEALGETLHEGHEILGKAMLALVVLHILGALKHLVIDKDGSFQRMLPRGRD
ncbi:cytochrome b [Parasphingopyxis lamellibrachiae]|uniref:Cytochrome b561 n=1 Tax=Parasphingopyxis lamellibrachiae TaxID=680125 RepID=A0A3D9FDS7_9SPHN|nr:cytochrome b [Parasphingopyxis lamellibrachiae]RED15206.1 cytochrome b561 [Parasphingopyxis lamellibrachiae]